MTRITGSGAITPRGAVRKTREAGGPFFMADAAAGPADSDAAVAEAGAAHGLSAMLAMQETALAADPGQPRRRDQAARRRGHDLLAALAGLQRALLGEPDGGASRASLRALLDRLPIAADPALAGVVRAIALRAHVELARDDDSYARSGG